MRFKMGAPTMVILAMSIIGLILFFTSRMAMVDYIGVLEVMVLGG